MLETKNLCKKYKPKKGVTVAAVNGISLKLPDTGMVFILGKSGSGKSTLLNLLGGLDRYDEGEIIINGVSSKSFKQGHFDSYRNTYVGFIFQEYNILDEFSVGANIALALELQGRRASSELVEDILREVDLEGYGNRRPNELSGGQKQRVAIARALVKNPAIIMADEPTGALDSNTGKQVFDTLKKLSHDKLVIVVSHDRDFAEGYADRIIELSDGRVTDDVSVDISEASVNALEFHERTIGIPEKYELTEEDRLAINEYIKSIEGKTELTIGNKSGKKFASTDQSGIAVNENEEFKLIKSKLPLKSAVRIGASGMKHKKLRLIFTIFLSVVSFVLFALADTFGSYDNISSCTQSIIDSDIKFASFVKTEKVFYGNSGDNYSFNNAEMNSDDIEEIKKNTGIDVTGVYSPEMLDLSISAYVDKSNDELKSGYDIYSESFEGFAEITDEKLSKMGYSVVAGTLPDGNKDELALSVYTAQSFVKYGFRNAETGDIDSIESSSELVGKKIIIGNTEYTICGIVDTLFNFDRYINLCEDEENLDTSEVLLRYALYSEFMYEMRYSFCNTAMVGEGFIEKLAERLPGFNSMKNGYVRFYVDDGTSEYDQKGFAPSYASRLSDADSELITWLDGNERSSLGEKEIIVSSDLLLYNDAKGYYHDSSAMDDESFSFPTEGLMGEIVDFSDGGEDVTTSDWKIVGIIKNEGRYSTLYDSVILPDEICDKIILSGSSIQFAVGAMPQSRDEIRNTVEYSYDENVQTRYELQSSVTYELNTVNGVLRVLSKVFLYIGIGFAVFASLMLANFIGTSIAYKKHEIGILRAIGSRSGDVFRIFFSESFIIAMINFVLASFGTLAVTAFINLKLRESCGILITVLNFGIRQVLLLFAVSTVIAALASLIPVKKIASKRPIDAIRDR